MTLISDFVRNMYMYNVSFCDVQFIPILFHPVMQSHLLTAIKIASVYACAQGCLFKSLELHVHVHVGLRSCFLHTYVSLFMLHNLFIFVQTVMCECFCQLL